MCSRKCFMFCVVLVLALAQVFAWPTSEAKAQKLVAEAEENALNPSSEMQSNVSTSYNEISTKLDGKLVVVGNDLETLKTDVTAMAGALTTLIADNRALNDSLDDMTSKYIKETKTKFFADAGAVIGFKNKAITLGIVGEMGIKLGKGLLVKTGVQYIAWDFGQFSAMPKWDIENLSLTCTAGWEW